MKDDLVQSGLFETFGLLKGQYLSSQKAEKDLYEEMERELAESKRRIELSYQNKINSAQEKTSALECDLADYRKLIKKFSTFDSKMIGVVIQYLVTLFEGENYSLQNAIHETYKHETTVFGSESFKVSKNLLMIVKGNNEHGSYYDYNENSNEVLKLVSKGLGFVLSENNCLNSITFYEVIGNNLKCLIDFGVFTYVKDFIDFVVQYRFKNSLDDITFQELKSLMNEFVLDNKEVMEEKYRNNCLKRQALMNEDILKRQEQLIQELARNESKCIENQEQLELEEIMKNGVPSRYSNKLTQRLEEDCIDLQQFKILYEGEEHDAKITFIEPVTSLENIFISKVKIEASINDYFDVSPADPHFHGFCDIDLIDDGMMGIVDISNLKRSLEDILVDSSLYRVDRINEKYLRVLFLPNNGVYKHKPIDISGWILNKIFDEIREESDEKAVSYMTKWNYDEEKEKLLAYLREIELLSNLNGHQLKLYMQMK